MSVLGRAQDDGGGAMFDRIASRYDLMNRIIGLGLDAGWRRRLVGALVLRPCQRVLDVATGTGDVAIAVAEACDVSVVGIDPSEQMLTLASTKIAVRGLAHKVSVRRGIAEALPFADESFDAVCVAFGMRNMPDRHAALSEMARATRPGGRVAVLELGEPDVGLLSPVARAHVHLVVPTLGRWLTGDSAYRYLAHSIAAFPEPTKFVAELESAGLGLIALERHAWGAANLFVATRRP